MALRLSGRLRNAHAMPSRMRTLQNSYLYSAICCFLLWRWSSSVCAQHVARERHLENFDRPFGDHHAALVAPECFDRKIGRKPHAAMDFHAAVGGMERLGVAENLCHVGLGADVATLI